MANNSIDLDTLKELKEIMEDEFNLLVAIFISDGSKQMEHLKSAINSSSAEEVRRIAHTLKGSSLNLGLLQLSEFCKKLEHAAAENKLDNADVLLQKIKTEYEEVTETLEKLLKN